jgi:hypothetical protein
MNLYGKAAEAAHDILRAFENPNSLPAPLAQVFIHRKDASPCRAWSWRNQLIVALRGHSDARGFRQWQQVGRHVKKGEKAFNILSPCVKKVDAATDDTFLASLLGGLEQLEEPPDKELLDAINWRHEWRRERRYSSDPLEDMMETVTEVSYEPVEDDRKSLLARKSDGRG